LFYVSSQVGAYDFILDAAGKARSSLIKEMCEKSLVPKGKYISIDDGILELKSERLMKLKQIIEYGHIKPIVDSIYPLDRIVEAHEYVGKGHKRGGVAISIEHSN
jgi:NADPH:quinone reductase-like Zn-dependent oxidoreductase